ncbi:hypothetical protein [Paraburkholderia kururiensis]|uniref:hypothetical protein n=1 Tax=Paraburkholderia kururiensis TaxID=984307 RepID=UPI0020D0FC76|nr:hypothetical protein [Paraburkholderia kururiensis]
MRTVRLPGRLLPRYNDALTELEPGLYLGLSHGRDAVDTTPDDWGFNGPVVGPLDFVHTTYAAELKLRFVDERMAARFFPATGGITNVSTGERVPSAATTLRIAGDLLVFDGRHFGDWTVFAHGRFA